MRRNRYLAVLSFVMFAIASTSLRTPAAPELAPLDIMPAKPDQPISLRDRLIVGLQARLTTEVGFCDSVAHQVETGHLPQRLVDETFFWSRQKSATVLNGHKLRPITYFQPAMRARADKLHLTL